MSKTAESEFGSGFLYPLVLFVGHAMHLYRLRDEYEKMQEAGCGPGAFSEDDAAAKCIHWAADHIREFDYAQAPESLRERCKTLQDNAMAWGSLGYERQPTFKEVEDLFEEAKEIFREIDVLNGVPALAASDAT